MILPKLTDDEIQMLWVNWDASRTVEWYECIEDLIHIVEDYIKENQMDAVHAAAQPVQEPVGYIDSADLRELCNGNERQYSLFTEDQGRMVAIYAHPVRTKDQTDDELLNVMIDMANYIDKLGGNSKKYRVVIAAGAIHEREEQAEQEPCIECGRPTMSAESKCNDCHSMDDAAPVRTKDLTDDEKADLLESVDWYNFPEDLINAAIAADREKNK